MRNNYNLQIVQLYNSYLELLGMLKITIWKKFDQLSRLSGVQNKCLPLHLFNSMNMQMLYHGYSSKVCCKGRNIVIL